MSEEQAYLEHHWRNSGQALEAARPLDLRPRLSPESKMHRYLLKKLSGRYTRFRQREYSEALSILLGNVVCNPHWFRFSRNGNEESYNTRVIEFGIQEGILEDIPGYYNRSNPANEFGRQSRARATPGLIKALNPSDLEWGGPQYLISLRSSNRERESLLERLPTTHTLQSLYPIPTPTTPLLRDIREGNSELLNRGNKIHRPPNRQGHSAAIELQTLILSEYHWLNRQHQYAVNGLPFVPTPLQRIFNRGSWEYGGRLYRGSWQQFSKEDRATITIDGEPTAELDYSALHPVMLYHLEGIDYQDDPYDVPAPSRAHAKLALLIAINARDVSATLRACQRHSRHLAPLDREGWIEVILALQARNQPIAKWLCSDVGIRLQNLDSQLALAILAQATQEGIPLLPVHDSFLARQRDSNALIKIMRSNYTKMLKIEPRIR